MHTRAGNIRGAVIMMIAMAAYTFNDALTRSIPGDVSVYQVMFLRGVLVTAALYLYVWKRGELNFRVGARNAKLLVWRTVGEVTLTVTFLTALFNAPLADVTAILQAAPLMLTFAGAVFFKERLGWRRLSAILVGFVGVLMIVQPGGQAFNSYSLLAVSSLVLILLRDLPTRFLSAEVSTNLTALIAAFSITFTGGVMMFTAPWAPITWVMVVHLTAAAAFVCVAYVASIAVMRVGELSFVQPFRYTGILWAILLGVVFFGEIPNMLALIGVAIVVGAGVFTFYREGRLKR